MAENPKNKSVPFGVASGYLSILLVLKRIEDAIQNQIYFYGMRLNN
ncbi:MAG: hypothetical protein OEL85_01185 [Desulfobulbaceae bacterium]|nr:hypothetical protein [Desulfobulbaceae bacterium]